MTESTAQPHDRRRLILCVIGIAQLLVVLDVTIVNVALPSAQQDLGFSDDGRQWVITAYALAFGSLLLLGGRIADLFGRKWTFIAGLLGFAGASALGGAASSFAMLVSARALQGAFGALLAPAALSLLSTTFTEATERAKAFSVYAALAGMGGAVGLLLGGALTELLDWRWCLYVSIAFALPAAIAGTRLLHHEPAPTRPRLDLLGVALASTGLLALVFGLARAETDGWGDPVTVAALALSAPLLVLFVLWQRRAAQPLLPLRVVADRDRGGSLMAIGFATAGLWSVLLFLTFYLQATKGFSAMETGLAFLPVSLAIPPAMALANTRLLPRTGPRPLVPLGLLSGAVGLLALTQVGAGTAYATHVVPGLVLVGLGFGLAVGPAFQTATSGVPARDSGAASAMVGTSQQIAGSIAMALLSTTAATAATPVEGYATAFAWAAGLLLAGALVCAALLRSKVAAGSPRGRQQRGRDPDALKV
jgi:EmrB/QacA subfamily drug resistance transporter